MSKETICYTRQSFPSRRLTGENCFDKIELVSFSMLQNELGMAVGRGLHLRTVKNALGNRCRGVKLYLESVKAYKSRTYSLADIITVAQSSTVKAHVTMKSVIGVTCGLRESSARLIFG
jgi:hypothetical protein